MHGEFDIIERYFAHLPQTGDDVRAGIGDDCARVSVPADTELAISIDTLLADVHFPSDAAPSDVGWKALACGLSDLAAGGATPRWCTLALTLTQADAHWLAGFSEGLGQAAASYGVALIGGDTTRGRHLTATIQVAGHLPAGTGRSRRGACVGDTLWLSGWPGEAAAGLAQWRHSAPNPDTRLARRMARPTPRIELGQALRSSATACIDTSDGLAQDALHIADASGVALVIDAAALPCSATLARVGSPQQRLAWMLHGGDDYELLATLPTKDAPTGPDPAYAPMTPIGTVEQGSGVWLRPVSGAEEPIHARGYRHFDPE
jgi:thiamine-monophosphate kinase